MRFIWFSFLGLLLVGLQTTISNLLFSGNLVVELALVLVVYTGFSFNWLEGALFSFCVGFLMDCLMGSVSGLLASSYLVIFLITQAVSTRVYAEKTSFIMMFTAFCAVLEAVFLILFYAIFYDLNKFLHIRDIFLPQAMLVSMLSPLLFFLFRRFEDFVVCKKSTRG